MAPDPRSVGSTRFHVAHLTDEEFYSWGLERAKKNPVPAVLRFLRGKKMGDYKRAFDEFAAAFQFPYYFGENWPAFDECLSDLRWVEGDSYLAMFMHSEAIYEAEPVEFPTLLKTLSSVSAYFEKPVRGQGLADRPAKPFHSVFQCDGSHRIERLLKEAGIAFDVLGPA